MLAKGFGEVGEPKAGSGGPTSGSQFLEQFKTAQALAQLAAQHSQPAAPSTGPSSWDTGSSSLGQYGKLKKKVHIPYFPQLDGCRIRRISYTNKEGFSAYQRLA